MDFSSWNCSHIRRSRRAEKPLTAFACECTATGVRHAFPAIVHIRGEESPDTTLPNPQKFLGIVQVPRVPPRTPGSEPVPCISNSGCRTQPRKGNETIAKPRPTLTCRRQSSQTLQNHHGRRRHTVGLALPNPRVLCKPSAHSFSPLLISAPDTPKVKVIPARDRVTLARRPPSTPLLKSQRPLTASPPF